MLTALFSDIHGNREAFEACLEHATDNGITRFVLMGDLVGYGADPAWVVERAGELVADGARAILGNHDAAIDKGTGGMSETAAQAIQWTIPQLNQSHRDFLKKLPMTLEQGDTLFVHASAHEPAHWDYITDATAAAESFNATNARVTLCGHVHVPALYHLSSTGKLAKFPPTEKVALPLAQPRRWLAVLGAVGQPRDRNPAACYAVLDEANASLTYVRVPYNIDAAANKIRKAGLPEWLADRLYNGR